MGEQKVTILRDKEQVQRHIKSLLGDVQALAYMIDNGWIESGITRIGAEQEMVLVNRKTFKPAAIAVEVLEKMLGKDWVETELAQFNLETNLTPRTLKGKCFSEMEQENLENLRQIEEVVNAFDATIVLTGVLPTLRRFDMTLKNLTPKKRYKALMDAINDQLIGSAYELRIEGIDELILKHNSPMLEACNTSFQVHLQVSAVDFAKMYNIAQTLTGPVMAIAANSPIVFGRRLWHESRIALFQQALDTRASHEHMRERSPRVSFGKDWLSESILEIYKEDISRFRPLISGDVQENAMEMIRKDKVPKLRALQVHNSTVYRWNRPCYGISDNGKPHLRIENRVLPSGPTVADEIANAVLWLGCVIGLAQQTEDVTRDISFEDVRDNFIKAAQFGIDTKFNWFEDRKISAVELVINELVPLARQGLKAYQVDDTDIDRYLGIIEDRAKQHMNGARWALRAYTKMKKETSSDEALTVVTSAVAKHQKKNLPVHTWPMPNLKDLKEYRPSHLKVSEFMTTDLFTVRKDDIIDFVAEIMDWRKIRFIPVEDKKGKLIGLVTLRKVLKNLIKLRDNPDLGMLTVDDIMIRDPITIAPHATIGQAMEIMRNEKIGSLPVVRNNSELIGIITEMDFLRITSSLLERFES